MSNDDPTFFMEIELNKLDDKIAGLEYALKKMRDIQGKQSPETEELIEKSNAKRSQLKEQRNDLERKINSIRLEKALELADAKE